MGEVNFQILMTIARSKLKWKLWSWHWKYLWSNVFGHQEHSIPMSELSDSWTSLHDCLFCMMIYLLVYITFYWVVFCVLAFFLGYSDTFVEHEVGGKSVAEIFKLYGEGFFRDKEVSWEPSLFLHFLQISCYDASREKLLLFWSSLLYHETKCK